MKVNFHEDTGVCDLESENEWDEAFINDMKARTEEEAIEYFSNILLDYIKEEKEKRNKKTKKIRKAKKA